MSVFLSDKFYNKISIYFLSLFKTYCFSLVYTGCGDTIARMYEAKSGTLKRTFKGHENAIVCVEVKLFSIFKNI